MYDSGLANVDGRSLYGDSLMGLTNPCCGEGSHNFLIRVDIDPFAAPVGGVVMPVNKLAVVAPYLALFGVVAAVAVVIVAPWKKPEN